jgi:uncharacterized protein (DUF433 family)
VLAAEEGCYEARRAAALTGVPVSTVYYWAKTGIVVPSISPVREKLWSYADLMCLRIVSWLRRPKDLKGGVVPATTMRQVRETLAFLDRQGLNLWQPSASTTGSPLLVDRSGTIWVRHPEGGLSDHAGHAILDLDGEYLDLLAPYSEAGHRGPDLIRPRPMLRIVPSKVAGEPHIVGSRITSRSLNSLAKRGFDPTVIAEMYGLDRRSVEEAIDLERQLSDGAQPAA